jgi:hypothetical protein
MSPALIQAAATISVELLRRAKTSNGELSEDVIASAFETAAHGVAEGIARLNKRPPLNVSQEALDLLSQR